MSPNYIANMVVVSNQDHLKKLNVSVMTVTGLTQTKNIAKVIFIFKIKQW